MCVCVCVCVCVLCSSSSSSSSSVYGVALCLNASRLRYDVVHLLRSLCVMPSSDVRASSKRNCTSKVDLQCALCISRTYHQQCSP